MDSDYYIEILEKTLISNPKRKFNNRWRLQQDNDPKHQSPKTQGWLTHNVLQVSDWPSNSHGLNLIANLRNIIKRRTERRKPSNINDLKNFLNEEWNNIEKSLIINLIDSM